MATTVSVSSSGTVPVPLGGGSTTARFPWRLKPLATSPTVELAKGTEALSAQEKPAMDSTSSSWTAVDGKKELSPNGRNRGRGGDTRSEVVIGGLGS